MLERDKTILIVGLGLLGGKYAQVLSGKGYTVWGIDSDAATVQWALDRAYISRGAAAPDRALVSRADRVIFGLYPTVLLDWIKQYGGWLKPGVLATDVSGVKRGVAAPVQQMLPDGVEFIASHPMAGRETSGITHRIDIRIPRQLYHHAHRANTPRKPSPGAGTCPNAGVCPHHHPEHRRA